MSYDIEKEKEVSARNTQLLNSEQRNIHDEFVTAALNSKKKLFLLDAARGWGKTFLIHTILAPIRAQHRIAIATASSGLAATLLHGGHTIHSTFTKLNVSFIYAPLRKTLSHFPCQVNQGMLCHNCR